MTVVWILLAVLSLILLLMFLAVRVELRYDSALVLRLKILGIPIRLYPRPKKKIRLSDYRIQKIRRRQKKQYKKMQKRQQKKDEKKAKKARKEKAEEKTDILETIHLITALARKVIQKTLRYLRIDLLRLQITVGSEDAAKTAILYGAVSQSVAYLIEILSNVTKLRRYRQCVSVQADFISEKTKMNVNICFQLRVWQILAILIAAGMTFVKERANANIKETVRHTEKKI